MNAPDLTALLQCSECGTLDFKSKQYPFVEASDNEKAELIKDILAMANTCVPSHKYILIGVEEKDGRAVGLCGAETLEDSNIQQFVNSKTNRLVTFRVENCLHKDVKLTIIQIDKKQPRPIYLIKNFGSLKKDAVYLRRGSITDTATPDEIVRMGQEQIDIDQFWKDLKVLLKDLEKDVIQLRTIGQRIYDANIAECRLPVADARALLKQARAHDLGVQLCLDLSNLVELIETIDGYMALGAEKLNTQWLANLRSYTEDLNRLILKMKME